MKVLFFGAGPLGTLYAQLFHEGGVDVTVLARGERYRWLKKNGLVLVNRITGEEGAARTKVIDALDDTEEYDLAIVLVRKNNVAAVCEALARCSGISSVLFMGNNATGFEQYLSFFPREKLLLPLLLTTP